MLLYLLQILLVLQKWCHYLLCYSFVLFIQGPPSLLGHLTLFEKETEMRIFHPKSIYSEIPFPSKVQVVQNYNIPEIPTLPNLNFSAKFGHKFSNDEQLKTAFNTNASCAIALSLFKWIDVTPSEQSAFPLNQNVSLPLLSNDVLFSAVIDAIRHPPCVVNAASEYISQAFSNLKYIGVHWRYDKEDFGRVCKESWAKYYCDNMYNIEPKTLAVAIFNAITSEKIKECIPIYIATPSTLESFANEVYEELSKLNNFLVKPTIKLKAFLSSNYNICWKETGWKITEDIISLSEMEIMMKSTWFFYSAGSTWSEMIRPFRTDTFENNTIVKRFEANVFRLAVKAANEALKNNTVT